MELNASPNRVHNTPSDIFANQKECNGGHQGAKMKPGEPMWSRMRPEEASTAAAWAPNGADVGRKIVSKYIPNSIDR